MLEEKYATEEVAEKAEFPWEMERLTSLQPLLSTRKKVIAVSIVPTAPHSLDDDLTVL